jgi:chromosome segregation ATPase
LSGDARCEGAGGANPRIECRSCWQAFPAPEGLQWEVTPEAPPETPAASAQVTLDAVPAPPAAPPAGAAFLSAAGRIAEGLALLLRETVEELQRPTAETLSSLQSGLTDVCLAMEEVPRLRRETGALAEDVQSLHGRMATIETAIGAQAEDFPRVWEQLHDLAAKQAEIPAKFDEHGHVLAELRESYTQSLASHAGRLEAVESRMPAVSDLSSAYAELQRGQQALLARLDAQAEAIRVLHMAAQERIGNREELQVALQKLEQIAGALEAPKPLPEQL